MKPIFIGLAWLGVLLLAALLRFHDLGERPLHADEATGARITARLMDGSYQFDPAHYHGPTLGHAGAVASRIFGLGSWREMEIPPLRGITAVSGLLVAMLPVLWRRRFGDAPSLLAAAFLATSPILVYFSRMYIHEMLLALFAGLALWQASRARYRWLAGIWIGLMFATKETFAISMLAWASAASVVHLIDSRGRIDAKGIWNTCGRDLVLAGCISLVIGLAFYTQGFRHWQGAVDAVRTYFIYETVDGHDKTFSWYAHLMLWPELRGGFRWGEPALAGVALVAFCLSIAQRSLPDAHRIAIRFLAMSAFFHGLIYSCIPYKTPWLMVLPWMHVALLAGFITHLIIDPRRVMSVTMAIAIPAALALQLAQAHRSAFRFASDSRNPYAYPASSTDLNTLESWITAIDSAASHQSIEPIIVVGSDYWPLPWYLRRHQHVGYYPSAPNGIERLPLVFDVNGLDRELESSHTPILRGLRGEFPVTAWVRNDFWDAYLDHQANPDQDDD